MTAEEKRTRFHKGFKVKEYFKIRKRNEALDLRCYAEAALDLLDVDLAAQRRVAERRYSEGKAEKERVETKPTRSGKRNPSGGFVDGWKNR